MKLIVGLGNPGPEYVATRHNVGFMVVERLARRHRINDAPRAKFHSAVVEGPVADEKCLLMLPQTYMNRSGLAVADAMRFYKLDKPDLLVVVDDVALPVGRIRLRGEGSAGGHNGLTDIEKAVNGRDYPRLRIGIDPPGRARQRDYVLGRFSPDQLDRLDPAMDKACDAIECWIRDGLEKAMSLHNASD
ncbi:aminoacyl-tRNA hydrolase [Phycisphaerales bacterium AB-hyl4]|uniref:Peptidyl-tRNA hydrolase n=1 Tax=Natronomicrosphaera hydrolytica TaxID=3242702 RepID=A0ABV4U625_9BACT